MKFSSKIEKCNLSPIRKFYPYQVECKKQGKKIYPLNIGQPDVKTPEAYFEAIKNFTAPVLEYAPSPGIPSMIEAVKNYYHNIGIDYEASDILISTGGSEALQIALNCILDDGDEIIIPEPFYPNYNTFVKTTGATIRPLTTTPEEGYHYADREKIEALINENTRAIMFTNPGNPTGVVLTPEELKLMVDIAVEHDLFIIGDEVYREFAYDGREMTSFGQLADIEERVIIIDSVSKRFSACGARIGCLVCKNKEYMAQVYKIAMGRLCVPTLDMVGATAMYKLPADFFNDVRAEYEHRRNTAFEALQKIPGVVCKCPGGAFYITCKLPVESTEDLLLFLLNEFRDNNETVMYAPAEGFYATEGLGKDELRIAYILKAEDLARAIELLAKGIEAYKAKGGK